MRSSLLAALSLFCSSCALFLPAPVPMSSVTDTYPEGKARCLLVFLPGAGDRDRTFVEEHFIEAVRAKKLSVDVIAADATMGYYLRNGMVERLDADVMSKALPKGYERTWFAGMSMGGFGSLFYAQQRPQQVQGVLAMSPFLGDSSVTDQVRAAGGLANWAAPAAEPSTSANYQLQLWRWLQAVTVKRAPGPELYVGWGDAENLARDDSLLGAALPEDHVLHAPGKHDWVTWRSHLDQWLSRSTFATDCAQ